jgi:pyridinium-3,5-bisthiocarboxylic acid mononucleotide nickel chelatase
MRIAYFDCFSGISGDMCLGALVSAGWPAVEAQDLPRRLKLDHVSVNVAPVRRGPFAATKVDVVVAEEKQPHRHLHHVAALIDAADFPLPVKERAQAVFQRLAAAEAEVHGSTIEKVHFHEVGAADALVDVVGTAAGLHALGIERVFASPLPLGNGWVMSQHGRIPVPAPATAYLLRGVPVLPSTIEAELVTPTGAALLVAMVQDWVPPPAYRLIQVGTGAGTRELTEQPNVLRLMLGEAEVSVLGRRRVAVLETTVDDENPQFVAALIPRLLDAGALDAMWIPTLMKKGRPGTMLVVVAEPARAERLAAMIMNETTTLGVRVRTEERFELDRRIVEVPTAFGPVKLKVAVLPEGGERTVPEFESVREAAERSGRPLREVAQAAMEAWSAGVETPRTTSDERP